MKYVYDAKFEENILTVGQKGCAKITFVQSLAKNNMFGNMKEVYWLSKISLIKDREKNINDCSDIEVNIKYQTNSEKFDNLLDFFQRRKDKISCE